MSQSTAVRWRVLVLCAMIVCSGAVSVVSFSGSAAAAGPAGMTGSGTFENPYVIRNVVQLQAMEQNLDALYVLGNDIDASGVNFRPVGREKRFLVGNLSPEG